MHGALRELMDTIHHRKQHPSPQSYTTQLMSNGLAAILGKIEEESAEFVAAAREPESAESSRHLIHEAADLIYHMLVMLSFRGLDLCDIENELQRRAGRSGLDEKAARKQTKISGDNPS